ncbi:MAG TPA: ATP-binding cassette domain-containing protein [Caulobacteraceae bacterium]|jgi:ABC-2 type transport system ATP-binding protein|nr:ATP-binding cassette domain-containing protein [Caulobacteraceae bacterium]
MRDDVGGARPALSVEGLTKRYGAFTAVDDLSFTLRAGDILGFLGPNGAGKTTTVRMILGLVVPTAGRINLLGEDDPAKVRDKIGFLPEERGLYRRMTPVQAIGFLASLKGLSTAEGRRRGRELLIAHGMEDVLTRPIKSLSKGMAQKVQILSTLAHGPDLVILDEPFSGLDPANQQALEDLIRGVARDGATVIFSTHVMQHAERLCDQVLLMANGRKVFDGTVEAARTAAPRTLVLEGRFDPAALADLPGIADVSTAPIEDGAVRVILALKKGAPAQDALREAFTKGLDILRFELREPHLHDAFLVLTNGGGGEGEA